MFQFLTVILNESKEHSVYQLSDGEFCIRFELDAFNLSFHVFEQPNTFTVF